MTKPSSSSNASPLSSKPSRRRSRSRTAATTGTVPETRRAQLAEILRLRALNSERVSKFSRLAAEMGDISDTALPNSHLGGLEESVPTNTDGEKSVSYQKPGGTTFSITREELERAKVKGFLAEFYRENCSLELVVTYQDIRKVVLNAVRLAEEEFPDVVPDVSLHS